MPPSPLLPVGLMTGIVVRTLSPKPLYRHSGGLLLRAAATSDGRQPASENPAEDGRRWLRRVWSWPTVRHAVQAANPELHARVETLIAGQTGSDRSVSKAVTSVSNYLARLRRPTPFGLFAGVAPVTVAPRSAADWGEDHQTHTGADHTWVAGVIERLHACPELMSRVPVMAHNLAVVRGDRLVVPGPPTDDRTRRAAPVEVTTAHTAPVAAVMKDAHVPIPHSDLIARLAARFPRASTEQVTALVNDLLTQGFLISGLWAPTTESDPLAHLCTVLDRVGAENITAVSDLVKQVRSLHERLQAPSTHTCWPDKARLRQEMCQVTDVTPVPLVADTVLDGRVRVTPQVISALERAADVLTRVSAHPFGVPVWRDYHARFRERYGPAAAVPVLELVADSGLGWPAGYLGADRQAPATVLNDRDTHLLQTAQEALASDGELVLTDELITRLDRTDGTPITPPGRVEIAARIHASTTGALDRGDFTVWVTSAPRPGSSLFGRFLPLLDPDDRERLSDSFTDQAPDTVTAHLSFHARQRRNDNIVRTTPVAPTVVSLGEHRSPGDDGIDLADLAVTADATSLSLVRLSTGQRVIIQVPHPLEPRNQTPPLARFLAEVGAARTAFYGPFDFGAASRLARLPRVRHGNAVLSPARWALNTSDVPDPNADQAEWEATLAAWQDTWGVPDHVALVEHDRELPLDLTTATHRYLLRRRLQAQDRGRVRLCEAPAPQHLGWVGRSHELVAALHTTAPATCAGRRTAHITEGHEDHVPGSQVINARFRVHPDRVQRILTDHLPTLVEGADCLRWWFRLRRDLSHVDAPTYLEVTLRAPGSERTGEVIQAVHGWTKKARKAGLLPGVELLAHHPQYARYGTGAAAEAAEAVFNADSTACLAQRRLTARTGTDPTALAAASMVDLATGLLGSPRAANRWLVQELDHKPGPVDPAVRRLALAWNDTTTDGPDHLWTTPVGQVLRQAWTDRTHAVDAYRSALQGSGPSPSGVLRSLLHLHHTRAQGVDHETEAATVRAARAIALTRTHRRP